MLRSLGLGLGLETFANFLRVSVLVSENLVTGKKSQFGFRKIWSRKKSIGFGFGKFGFGKQVSVSKKFGLGQKSRFRNIWFRKKVSVSVSENLVSEKKSRFRFRKIWSQNRSIGFGFKKIGLEKKS